MDAIYRHTKGLRRLGSGTLESTEGRTPWIAVSLEVAVATGRSTIAREAQRTAKEIAVPLGIVFQKQGRIERGGLRFGTRDSADGRADEPHR
jgi:hypothetical protein